MGWPVRSLRTVSSFSRVSSAGGTSDDFATGGIERDVFQFVHNKAEEDKSPRWRNRRQTQSRRARKTTITPRHPKPRWRDQSARRVGLGVRDAAAFRNPATGTRRPRASSARIARRKNPNHGRNHHQKKPSIKKSRGGCLNKRRDPERMEPRTLLANSISNNPNLRRWGDREKGRSGDSALRGSR